MKRFSFTLLVLLTAIITFAQVTKRLTKQIDAFKTEFTYVGEVKNNKPDGKGLAIYASGDKLYADFKNGLANGKGIFLYANKRALIGNFVDGFVSGETIFMLQDGTLYIGGFSDNAYNGYGKVLTNQNLYTASFYKDGKKQGRSLEIGADGYIFDGTMVDSKRNGPGVQYEPKNKTLFEGTWKDDNWVGASTTSIQSFIKSSGFAGGVGDDQTFAGKSNPGNNFLTDSCLLYKVKTNERYFGYFKDGFLVSGFHASADSIKYWGGWGPKGSVGYGIYCKRGGYLGAGNFTDGILDGNGIYLNVADGYIYDGYLTKGKFTGKGVFVTSDNRVITGDFTESSVNGPGTVTYASGIKDEGDYEKGVLKVARKVTSADGVVTNCQPKTFGEAMNELVKQHSLLFDPIMGASTEPDEYFGEDALSDSYATVYNFPGSVSSVISDDLDSYYFLTKLLETSDATAAKAKYKAICDQVLKTTIQKDSQKFKFALSTEETYTPEDTDTSSLYALSNKPLNTFVQVSLVKAGTTYSVYLRLGDK